MGKIDLSEILKETKENTESNFDLKKIENLLSTIDKLLNNKLISSIVTKYLESSSKMQYVNRTHQTQELSTNKKIDILKILDSIIEAGGGDLTLKEVRQLIAENENIRKLIENYV